MSDSLSRIKVLVVDDSAVIRGMISREIQQDPRIMVIASAMNGRYAIDELKRAAADVLLLDIEMPEMNGIEALPKLLEIRPDVKIIMVSSLTRENAEHTMEALEKGASDYIAKPSNQRDKMQSADFFGELRKKILALGSSGKVAPLNATRVTATPKAAAGDTLPSLPDTLSMAKCDAIAIGSSTGGPQALLELFKQLAPRPPKIPIFITQHMPATFTRTLANHLQEASQIPCKEAEDGEQIQAGHAYVAPGNYHMIIQTNNGQGVIRLNQESPINFCRPSVDPMFESLAKIYGKHLLAVMLTGMGQDGLHGVRIINQQMGKVIVQERKSCVVWGMPKAVVEAGLADAEMTLPQISAFIGKVVR